MNLFIAVPFAAALALTGQRLGWLTVGGAVAATVVGAAVFAGAGLAGATLLALFFVSGSILTRLSTRGRPARTGRQVFANGTCAALGAAILPASPAGWPLLAGALSAAQADTWATELGRFSKRATRLITSGKPVDPGTSGGVSLLGTGAGVLGAALMGSVTALLGLGPAVALAALGGGGMGFLLDSVLGATVQAKFRCHTCQVATEVRVHACGERSARQSGWGWLDNDGVNFLSASVGGVIALALWSAL